MEARKANKVYQIDKRQADEYAAQGYDIYDGGELVLHAVGKTVPIAEYERLQAELEAARHPEAAKGAKAKAEAKAGE